MDGSLSEYEMSILPLDNSKSQYEEETLSINDKCRHDVVYTA